MSMIIYTIPINPDDNWYDMVEAVSSGETRSFIESCFFTIWPYMNTPPDVLEVFIMEKLPDVVDGELLRFCPLMEYSIKEAFQLMIVDTFTYIIYELYRKLQGFNLSFKGVSETVLVKDKMMYHLLLG